MSDGRSGDLTKFNLVASVVLTAVGLLALFYLIPFQIPAAKGLDQGLSARFMPTLAAGTLAALAVLLGMNVFVRMLRGQPPLAEDNEENDAQGFGWRESVNAIILIVGSAGYVALFSSLGFVAASAIGLLVCLLIGGVRNWVVLAFVLHRFTDGAF